MSANKEQLYHSFQQLFNTWYNTLCNYAYSFLKDRDTSEDIVQEVFVRIWEDRPQIIGTEGVRYYLFTAVRNNCISRLRKEKRQVVLSLDEGMPTPAPERREDPDYRALVRIAIDELPPRCREVFLLSRFSKMTYKDIARSLDISEKTVENQLGKALKLIRAFLKGKGVYLAWALVNIFL
jgi:RNA polymerase sigma-70 factor (family 1)